MIIGIYTTLGLFHILAAKNPLEHLSLTWPPHLVQSDAWRNYVRWSGWRRNGACKPYWWCSSVISRCFCVVGLIPKKREKP